MINNSPTGVQNQTNKPVINHPPFQWTGLASLFSKEKITVNIKSRHIWNSFFDIYKYGTPPTFPEAKRRVEVNVANYYIQYSLIIILSLMITIVAYGWWSILIFSIIILGFWGISYGWPRQSHVFILPPPCDGIQISWQAAISIWSLISFLSILSSGSWIILPTALGFSTTLIGLHGIFHASEPDLSINIQEDDNV